MANVISVQIEGQTVFANSKTFKTGSVGFYGAGKVLIDGKRHQVGINIVEIGSKPNGNGKSSKKKS